MHRNISRGIKYTISVTKWNKKILVLCVLQQLTLKLIRLNKESHKSDFLIVCIEI